MLLSVVKPILPPMQDLDEEDGSLYWNFQEFCVLKFRKGVEDQGEGVGNGKTGPSFVPMWITWPRKDFMRSMGSSNAWEQIEDMKISFTLSP